MKTNYVKNDERPDSANETLNVILETHFDGMTKPNIDAVISQWSQGENEEKQKEAKGYAIEFFRRAFNDSREDFTGFLEEEFEGCEEAGFANSRYILDVLSKHSSGSIDETDPMLRQCKVVSDLTNLALKQHIGTYFRAASNAYMTEKYPEYADQIASDHAPDTSAHATAFLQIIGGHNAQQNI